MLFSWPSQFIIESLIISIERIHLSLGTMTEGLRSIDFPFPAFLFVRNGNYRPERLKLSYAARACENAKRVRSPKDFGVSSACCSSRKTNSYPPDQRVCFIALIIEFPLPPLRLSFVR